MTDKDQELSRRRFTSLRMAIPAYLGRQFNDVAYYMDELGLTTQQIEERLRDPRYQRDIFHAAPMTVFIQTLYANLQININHSMVKGKFTRVPVSPTDNDHYYKDFDAVRFIVNTYPLKLDKREHDLIAVFLARNYKVDVEIHSLHPKEFSLDFIQSFDEIYTNLLVEFLQHEDFSAALTAMKFSKTRIFAVKQLGSVHPVTTKLRAIEAEFIRLHAVLSLMCHFNWMLPNLLSYELYPPDTK
jgi:hypothetical protein